VEPQQRRLAAILAADMVGYSRLMECDETGTLARLKTHRLELIDPTIAKNKGRIIKTTGDGMLVEFQSVADAVECAAEIQRRMARHNQDVSPARWIEYRIGINLGDVIVDDGDIFGDGVNVAARLQELAAAGGICVSAAVRDQVGDRLDVAFEDLGEQNVKNIVRPIRVFRVLFDSESLPRPGGAEAKPVAATKPSLVVLPFVNMSGDPEQEFFADGLTEDIITELFRELLVISRNSAFVHKGKAVKVRDIAREFGVQYVVEGSVRKAAERVRVTVQLIDAETDRHLWAERYDRKIEDIFAIQDEVSAAIVGTLPGRIEAAGHDRAKRKPTENMAAYEYVLTGKILHHVRRRRTTPKRNECSIVRSRSIRNTRTRMRGRLAYWDRHGSTIGARIAKRPGITSSTSSASRSRSTTTTATFIGSSLR
jgi:adenylate cyclase